MLQSVMVFPNNDFFNVTPLLDDNVAKLINTDQIESYMTSASTSPIQDYLLAPSNMANFHPQQHPNHHRHNTNTQNFPVSMPSMVSQSAPSSPSYPVKNEEGMDYLLYPSFDLASSPQQASPQPQVLSSQSPQQRMIPFTDVSLLQQRQHHQQQQQQHAQQLRLQHQCALEQQYQMSTVTSAIISSIAANTNLMAPSFNTNMPTPMPFDPTPTFNFRPNGSTYAAHPAAPKRKREDLAEESMVPVTPSPSSSSSTVVAPLSPSISSPSLSVSTPTSRISTSSRLDKIKPARSTRVTKSASSSSSPSTSMISSAATTASSSSSSIKSLTKKTAKKSTTKDSEDVDSSASIDASNPHTGNITHPRRAAQNRAAQRTFRNRRKAYIKELEQKVQKMDRTREMMETIHQENQEVWRRVQILEALASQSGLQLPIFPTMTPFSGMEASIGSPYGGHMMVGHHSHSHGHSRQHGSSSSSNEDEEDDEEMREISSSQASYMDPRFHHHQSMDMHRQL
ncbi:hypothetical protein BGZ82_006031 [Podila clonocystis]|nr:hypothetical protein BGZ82_006031 [Podila clonocystis]